MSLVNYAFKGQERSNMTNNNSNTRNAKARQTAAQKFAATPRAAATKSANRTATPKRKPASKSRKSSGTIPEIPSWVGIAASVVGAGLAAGFLAWRQYQANGSPTDDFNAAFADGETDAENFDQTRNAGTASMRSDHDETSWEDVDEMADASFPASDPPSFNPGTA
jgi:hypothetical protein